MKELKAITLGAAHKKYIEGHTVGFYTISYEDRMSFGDFIDLLKEQGISIL